MKGIFVQKLPYLVVERAAKGALPENILDQEVKVYSKRRIPISLETSKTQLLKHIMRITLSFKNHFVTLLSKQKDRKVNKIDTNTRHSKTVHR